MNASAPRRNMSPLMRAIDTGPLNSFTLPSPRKMRPTAMPAYFSIFQFCPTLS